MKIDIRNIFPLIVPSSYYSKATWDLFISAGLIM